MRPKFLALCVNFVHCLTKILAFRLAMPCSLCGDPGHNKTKCPLAERIKAPPGEKDKADAASLSGRHVPVQRPVYLESMPDVKPHAKPQDVWSNFESFPAGSPVSAVTKNIAPWVDQVLKQKLGRIISFFSYPVRIGRAVRYVLPSFHHPWYPIKCYSHYLRIARLFQFPVSHRTP